MPELPEVETTCRGIRPYLIERKILSTEVREQNLRWPVPEKVRDLTGHSINHVRRRAKYILIGLDNDSTLIIHLGMSGSLRMSQPNSEIRRHDHILVNMDSGMQLRYHDPRRFGCWLWTEEDPLKHPLLENLGPEPLGEAFFPEYLKSICGSRHSSIKQVLMDSKIVVGIGNIYACEALFQAGIHPRRKASRVSYQRHKKLIESIKEILRRSIAEGGTTLRDFVREDGQPGYFKQRLLVYDRENQPCRKCGRTIKRIVLGQRSTYYCPNCQH